MRNCWVIVIVDQEVEKDVQADSQILFQLVLRLKLLAVDCIELVN